ncbi:hypothetical protein AYL99_04647 [Fonsecaea erecta]|uniref:Uncharacterized protein n=1 Tax=Fonsecaea erecta TaxID=1367422 RepID=A0A178ZRI1_9EURO|nr:hypothetical protein AYL99_04647 [Fonsecaea erecta]OAP62444.1 hypothetical protein AYL99_04647 [Fonsecaea erecta]
MKLLYLLPLLLVVISADDHPPTDDDPDHTSTVEMSTSTHHLETEHVSTVQISTSTHHSETEEHTLTVSAITSTHHPDTEHTSTVPSSTNLSGSNHTPFPSSTFSNGIMTTTTRPPSSGVVCRPLPGSTLSPSPSLTAFCLILSAHPMHTGMMGGGGMMGSEYQCPDYNGSGFHYTMNMMGSIPMCCTASATLTRVEFSVGCCPCGSICTGSIPRAQNWYTAAEREQTDVARNRRADASEQTLGQVVLTTGAVPGTATATATATPTVVEGGASDSSFHRGTRLSLFLLVSNLILAVLMGSELFS